MQLNHEFTVPAPIGEVWSALLDPERVAPCMPGATLSEVDGAKFTGSVKVKLGPVSLLYKGSGEFTETDESARKVVISASGKDSRGNGTASATVTVTLRESDGGTHGSVATELNITGKPAQFGRGMISDVGGKILHSFADCLAEKLGDAKTAETPRPADPEPIDAKPAGPAHRAQAPKDEPAIDLLDYAGSSVVKRAVPAVAGLVLLGVVFSVLRRRKRRTSAEKEA